MTLIFVGLSSEEGRLGAQATETANVMKAITLKAFAVLLSRGNSSPWKRVTISRNTREYSLKICRMIENSNTVLHAFHLQRHMIFF